METPAGDMRAGGFTSAVDSGAEPASGSPKRTRSDSERCDGSPKSDSSTRSDRSGYDVSPRYEGSPKSNDSPKSTKSHNFPFNHHTTSPKSKRSSRTSFSDYDLDKLNSEIASATAPLNNSGFTSLKTHETTIKYFLASGILFPSVCAVLIPTTFWTASTVDIANLFTNSIVILLTAWAIKFTIEWPWNWFNQLQHTKYNLINYVNSTFILPHDTAFNEAYPALNNQIFVSKLVLLKKIIRLEKIALAACLLLSFAGSSLMCWSREYIIVEETKKKIIFNNINIMLYQVWLTFRLILTITSHYQTHDDLNDDGYNVLTEYNLHTFLPATSKSPSDFTRLINQILPAPAPAPAHEKKPDLEKLSKKQTHMISKLMTAQNNQFTAINDYLNKLDTKIGSLAPKEKMLTPFPLSLRNATLETIEEDTQFPSTNFRDYSLHGIKPVSKLPLDVALKFDLSYDSEIASTKEPLSVSFKPNEVVSLSSFAKHIFHTLGKKGTIRYALQNPGTVLTMLFQELHEAFMAEYNSKYHRYHENSQLVKSVLWEALNKYLFANFNIIMDTLTMVNSVYLYPIRKVRDLALIVLKLQYHLIRFYVGLLLFVPRLWIKYTVVKPIMMVKNAIVSPEPSPEPERESEIVEVKDEINAIPIKQSAFKGMKEFHLNSNPKRNIIKGDKIRTAALRKLSKKLNIELESSIVRTPVRLVGEV